MKSGRCGSVISSAFSCLIISVLLSVATVQAGQWDTTGAHQAFLKAEKGYVELSRQPKISLSKHLNCARAYRQVYVKDPHYIHAADAVYREGLLYQKLGKSFDKDSYHRLAVKRFKFLISDYGGNEKCPDALVRIREIYSKNLNNQSEADNAYQILRTQYNHSSVARSAAAPQTIAIAAPEQPVAVQPQEKKDIRTEKKSIVRNIRHWSSPDYTRLVIDMDSDAQYKDYLLHNPKRMYFDIANATLNNDLHNKAYSIQDKFIKRVRVAQNKPDIVRIVVDFSIFSACSIYKLQDPSRIVIDLHYHPNEQAKITKPQPVKPDATEKTVATTPEIQEKPHTDDLTTAQVQSAETTPVQKSIPQNLRGKIVSLGELAQKGLPDSPIAAEPTSHGKRTLTRMLGLKIGRIVLDPGHGGHDLGTVGPEGLLEKDLVLSLAFKLKKMLEQKLGSEVVLTRDKDTFVSLEERTDIANRNHADLFISIHANSSRHRSISGVETYYLDFAKTDTEREVAARENAGAGNSVSDLEGLIKKIAQADKSAESRELASIIQNKLFRGARNLSSSTKDRGVRRAPFVVLIGANMPSILTEVAFISNPKDEKILRKEQNREHIADALFSGIEDYMKKLGSYPIAYRTVPNK